MSFNPFDFLRAIRDDKRLSATDKSVAVLSLLSRRNSESCRCDPSLKTVCSDAGVTDPRTATRALAALEACGYIQVEKARGIRNRYLLTVPAKALSSNAPTLDVPTSNAHAFDAGEVHTSNVGGVPTSNVCRTTKRTTKELLGGADVHACDSAACPTVEDIPADVFGPDPDISNPPVDANVVPEKKPAKKKRGYRCEVDRPDDVDPQLWTDFIKNRQAKKCPVTQTLLRRYAEKGKLCGMSLSQVLTTIIERNWQGFEPAWLQKEQEGRACFKATPERTAAPSYFSVTKPVPQPVDDGGAHELFKGLLA